MTMFGVTHFSTIRVTLELQPCIIDVLMVIVFFGIKCGHIYRWHSRTRERINLSS